ncbi:phosphotransferase family enzyme [Kribbella voronezhensis]|uniref:Phosphotransferase family enzyme n=1 Tax=Kribbella voronezhensis TaxID=2512212 RepID=A0A4R7T8F4_9ACTN|nr:aminoglycoside phosphotransferase family protein [Kribbella voronezhensis]TDU87939.1 phosphotransferase family enzyme [Kribbella voronezhensis]
MDDEAAVAAVLVATQLKRFREVCEVDGPIEPRFNGATKHVLLADDRAFLFPRNHTIVAQLERECDVYATVDHPLVSKLLGRWDEPAISPYPFFAVTRLQGSPRADRSPEHLRTLAVQLGATLAACHDIGLERVPRRLWANAWSEPPTTPPTAAECYTPLRELGGAERLADAVAPGVGPAARKMLLEALRTVDTMDPVLAHGDLYEDHLLLDASGALTGILDWGFGGVLSPLVDFTCSQWDSASWAVESSYGDLRRHLWTAYAERRSTPLPSWEQVHLALTTFDITALAPETKTHYYWQKSPEWQATRRATAQASLKAQLT